MRRGVAGGVVVQDAFKQHFLADESGNISGSAQANVNGNVVSVLQAGAFFGALGSAPISCTILGPLFRLLQISKFACFSPCRKKIYLTHVFFDLRPGSSKHLCLGLNLHH